MTNDKNRIVVIGAGYVGLTLGLVLKENGNDVFFVEKDSKRLAAIVQKQPFFYEPNFDARFKKAFADNSGREVCFSSIKEVPKVHDNVITFWIITLGTPLDDRLRSNLDPIYSVSEDLRKKLARRDIIILRSTVAPGTTRALANSLSTKNISFCPERTVEGAALEELVSLPQVVSAGNQYTWRKIKSLFEGFVPSIVRADSFEEAEFIKLASNVYRDLNFSFANYLALMCHKTNANVYNVIAKANFSYARNNIPYPGPVGGPCLEKDTYILSTIDLNSGHFPVIARRFNEDFYLRIIDDLIAAKETLVSITIYGAAFKGNPITDDTRGSPSLYLVRHLMQRYPHKIKNLQIVDPLVRSIDKYKVKTVSEISKLRYSDFGIIMTNHKIWSETETLIKMVGKCERLVSFWPVKTDHLRISDLAFGGGIKNEIS